MTLNQLHNICLPNGFNLFTDQVLERGWIGENNKNYRKIIGSITNAEAKALASIITQYNCKYSFETGVACGISTLAITQAITFQNGHHYGIDPYQYEHHDGVALTLLQEHDLAAYFTLLEGSSHTEAPKLLQKLGRQSLDFAFIDGMHTYDYKVIDFFYANKLLKIDGILAFHDLHMPSVKKVVKFIEKYGNYRVIYIKELEPKFFQKVKHIVGGLSRFKPYWSYWPSRFSNLLVLQKINDAERSWDYFENF